MTSLIKRQRARRNRSRGFTLLELVFVAAILIIVSALAVPRFGKTFDLLRLQNFISDTVSFARYAQAKAITDGKVYRLVFDLEKKTLKIESDTGAEEGKWGVEKGKLIPDYVKVELQDGKVDIKFYPDGTADKATVMVSVPSGKSYTILTEPATGYVRSEETKQE
jgi:Tfp pilus assembly protein FimT